MRTAPCINAPIVKKGAVDVIVPKGASFTYLDRNSRQSSDCEGYGYEPLPIIPTLLGPVYPQDFCWVLGKFNGVTGWLPVLETPLKDLGVFGNLGYEPWSSALCTVGEKPSDGLVIVRQATRLVSDDGSATGCAELSRDLTPGCFPANATALLRNGSVAMMTQLQLGDEVAVWSPSGAVAWEPIYAFGHRDEHAFASFVELSADTTSDNTLAAKRLIQVRSSAWGGPPAFGGGLHAVGCAKLTRC